MRLRVTILAFCWIGAGLGGMGLPAAQAKKAEPTVKVIRGEVSEDQDRLVDQAAVAAQQESIRRLQKLLQRYKNTSHEPVLLAKLAELFQQEGSLRFRIAHGKANKKNAAVDMAEYKKTMKESVDALNSLISRFPDYEGLDLAYFMRGRAHQEIGDKANAKKDYGVLVKRFPEAPEAASAYMALAEYSIEENKYEEAIGFLIQVEKKPESPQYPFALYKLGWSHYNLKNIPRGLSFLERHIAYYRKPANERDDVISTSEQSLRENSLMDLAMFYFDGIEKKLSDFNTDNALPYFKKQQPGEFLGRMSVRFGKHLRAARMQEHLISWKNLLIKDEVAMPETIEVVMVLFEDQINQRRIEQLGITARDFVRIVRASPKIKNYETYVKAQKLLLDTAEKLQALTIKNKQSEEVKSLTGTLSALYSAFIDIVNSKDPRVPKVHYNLAETLFEIKDFEGATEHYRWVVDNWKNQKTFDLKVAGLKAIASRYEVARSKGWVPGTLQAKSFSGDKADPAEPEIEEWVKWIDEYAKSYPQADETFENLRFEADRTLYGQGRTRRAVQRMLEFAEGHPTSKFAVPGASLALDTYVATGDWEKTNHLASHLNEQKALAKGDFGDRVYSVAADSFYKTAEFQQKTGDFKQTLKKSEQCVSQYSKSQRLIDCLLLAGKSALAVGQEEKAEGYFSQLIREHASTDPGAVALLERAQIFEKNFRFQNAAADYRAYLATSVGKKLEEDRTSQLWDRTLQLLWISGANSEILSLVKTLPQCRSSLLDTCTRLEGFAYLANPTADSQKEAITRVLHGKREQKSLWAVVGMKGYEKVPYKDRLLLVKAIADNWEKLDPISQFALLPELNDSYVKVFESCRKQIPSMSPLKATPKAIKRRVEFIQEFEGVATSAMKLPWARLRADLLNEVAEIYTEFAVSVRTLPLPEGLPEPEKQAYDESIQKIVFPFEEKGSDLRRKAFELASNFAVEDRVFQKVGDAFFKENASQAKALELNPTYRRQVEFDIDLLNRISKYGYWARVRSVRVDKIRVSLENRARAVQSLWFNSLDRRNWPAAAYFLAEAQKGGDKNSLPKNVTTAMKAYSLAIAGARAEAYAELFDERSLYQGAERGALVGALVAAHLSTLSKTKVKDLISAFEKESDSQLLTPMITNRDDAFTIAFGAEWAGAKLLEQNQMDLYDEATLASVRAHSKWAKEMGERFRAERKIASTAALTGKKKKAGN